MDNSEKQDLVKDICVLNGCSDGFGPWCRRCGFNRKELERRESLPLEADSDGLYRKRV